MKSLKKTLIEIQKNNPNKAILFFDESRFGTKTKTGLAWFKKGSRTRIKVKLGFKNFYIYSAINTATGKHFSLLLPSVNSECMNIFLEELSKTFVDEFILIMDGAGWHRSKALVVPRNTQIVLLPPYCPELNPVEKLWKYVKDNTIKNKVFEVLSDLEDEVCRFLSELEIDVVRSICGSC